MVKLSKLIIFLLILTYAAGCSNKEKEVTTASGLTYIDVKEGTGPSPARGQKVSVVYIGTLQDGTRFDASLDKEAPYVFTIGTGEVIQGWDEGIMSMKVGGRRKLIVPPGLAWGASGSGDVIPPNATVLFEIQLLGVK